RTWRKTTPSRVVRIADRVLPHDQGVFAVVGVVAASDAARLEAEPAVQRDGPNVRDPHLEGVTAAASPGGQLEEPLEQRRRDPLAPVLRGNGDVHHVPGVDVPRDNEVTGELIGLQVEGAETDRRRLRELA